MIKMTEMAGHKVSIEYVPEIAMFRGKFMDLSGYCDFVADSIDGLKQEAQISLDEFMSYCKLKGIDPYVGKKLKTFTFRYPADLSDALYRAAEAENVSINQFILQTVNEKLSHLHSVNFELQEDGKA